MVNKYEEELASMPVEKRRGVWTTWEADTWEAILIKGGFDEVIARLESSQEVGEIEPDVTEAVLDGKQPAPDGLWYLLVELVGTDWLHVAHGMKYFDRYEALARQVGVPVMRTGFQDTAGATHVAVREGADDTLVFESTGMSEWDDEDDEAADEEIDEFEVPLRFEAKWLSADWPKQFNGEDEVQQALMRELEAYVPMLGAGQQDGNIQLWAGHNDVVNAKYIKRIALVSVG